MLYDVISVSAVQQSESVIHIHISGFPQWLSCKESACNVGDPGLIPGWEDPLEKEMATTPVLLSVEFHGQRSLAGCSP